MPKADATDEAVIDAPPLVVYKAVLDEYAGRTMLWMPFVEIKSKGNIAMDCEGGICDVITRSHGLSGKFTDKVTKLEEGKLIALELAGDLVGTETWAFEPIGEKTKVTIHWIGGTNTILFALLGPFVSVNKVHSEITQKALAALGSHLSKK
jgi:hypothetical protein